MNTTEKQYKHIDTSKQKEKISTTKKVVAGLAAIAALASLRAYSVDEPPKANATVQIQDTPHKQLEVEGSIEATEESTHHSSIEVYNLDDTHFMADVAINPNDSEIDSAIAQGEGAGTVAIVRLAADSAVNVNVTGLTIGEKPFTEEESKRFMQVRSSDTQFEIVITQPEQFHDQGMIQISLTGESQTADPNIDSNVAFAAANVQ